MRFIRCIILLLFAQCLSYAGGENSFPDNFAQKLDEALDGNAPFYVITVTRDLVEDKQARDPTYKRQQRITVDSCRKLLTQIEDQLKSISDKPLFVVFNEYFFSRDMLTYDQYNDFVTEINTFSQKNPNVIIYANFLYQQSFDDILKKEDQMTLISKLFGYQRCITLKADRMPTEEFSPCGCIQVIKNSCDYMGVLKNETSVFFRNKIISRYRKSTYYNEDNSEQKLLYYFGFGQDELEPNLTEIHKNVAAIINTKVCTDICLDLQRDIRYRLGEIFNSGLSGKEQYDEEKVKFLNEKVIGQTYKSPKEFKLRIIQSNTTDIHECPNLLLNDKQVIVQSDPLAQMVFMVDNDYATKIFENKALTKQLLKTRYSQMCLHYKPFESRQFELLTESDKNTGKIKFFQIGKENNYDQ